LLRALSSFRAFSPVEDGLTLHVYFTTRCSGCALKAQCTTGKERRIKRCEHEAVLDAMEERLKQRPEAMRIRKRTVEHAFGTLKRSTHFLTQGPQHRRRRDEPPSARLQSEALDRHHRRAAASRRDQDLSMFRIRSAARNHQIAPNRAFPHSLAL
jgi:hypothetical protein